ncbi:MAG: shikimate dehydrogenase [Acidaminococcus sp.]|jgi:shikimate dehydrogenase|nr:shikimate dehydrogenase [Acidaminococcus sp.]MCI2100095.1 shikimate dehydrogenase [Acidaminococcus sp.]MCI2114372.1 shikimate dehydrogenase [Acidaminococcus sp.]MCI2116323.1 shikimate dehydrogenase [Acidaminococcus sp.]
MMRLGLLGEVLGHSWSPEIHQLFFQETGIEGTYKLVEVPEDRVDQFLKEAGEQFDGLNVTIPYKVKASEEASYVSPEAKAIGAVNTLKFDGGTMEGHNTDYFGFGRLLAHNNIVVEGKDVVVLGSGGAARAVLQNLLNQKPASLTVMARNLAKGHRDLERFFSKYPALRMIDYAHADEVPAHDLIVNTTPVGMYPRVGVSAVGMEVLGKTREAAVDIVYNPAETEFLRLAGQRGLVTCNGLYMLVAQAMASEEIWLGRKIEPELTARIAAQMEEKIHA